MAAPKISVPALIRHLVALAALGCITWAGFLVALQLGLVVLGGALLLYVFGLGQS